jgi:hypothetical protein
MSEFKLEWKHFVYEPREDLNFKTILCQNLLKHHFSLIEKENYKKIGDFDLYCNLDLYQYVDSDYHYVAKSEYYHEFHIIFNEFNKDSFIIGFSNTDANENYRKYIHVIIKRISDKFVLNSIPDFISTSRNEYKLWSFDNRNTYYEKLIDRTNFLPDYLGWQYQGCPRAPGGHPLEEGHEKMAQYLIEQIEKHENSYTGL